MSGRPRRFPILDGGFAIPWEMIAPHEWQAKKNHDQSLDVLASRGGLGPEEALCVLHGLCWSDGKGRWPNPAAVLRDKAKRWELEMRDTELADLRAENAKLKAALEVVEPFVRCHCAPYTRCTCGIEKARAALRGEPK